MVVQEQGSENESEIEFSMIDQVDFAGIDGYIKRHGLNDSSLADSRRAKIYNVNAAKDKKTKAGATDASDQAANGVHEEELLDGETELQKAERMLQDEEDEDEEDYVDEGSDDEDEDASDDDGGNGYDGGEVFEEEEEYDQEAGGYEDEG